MEKCGICFRNDKVKGKKYCQVCIDRFFKDKNVDEDEFKCRKCSEKFPIGFAAITDTTICRWCSGEEEKEIEEIQEIQENVINEDKDQMTLFNIAEYDKKEKEWKGMPEFKQNDLTAWKTIYVHFERYEDLVKFGKVIGIKLTIDTKSIWYPPAEIEHELGKRYISES